MLARTGIRHGRRSLAAFAAVLAVGMAVSLAALEVAARTKNAYPSYLDDADVADLVVNPSLGDARAGELITTTPGVTASTTDDFLIAGLDQDRPVTQAEIDSTTGFQVRMSTDGRYVKQDRPVVEEGRMLGDGPEAFLNRHAADELGLEVGAEITLAFFRPSFNTPGVNPARDDIVEPIGRAKARVVGIGTLATDVLSDELYPQSIMLITPEVGERFTCTVRPVVTDRELTIQEHLLTAFPSDCAFTYRFFSLRVAGGDAAVGAVADALVERFAAENERLPAVLRESDVGYSLIPTSTLDERTRVDQSLRPAVTALRLFGLVAGLATVVLALAGALRVARQEQSRHDIWRQLGVRRVDRCVALALPLAASAILGLLAAIALGVVGSGIGPVGSVRVLEPDPRHALSGSVLASLAAVAVAVLAGVLAIAWIAVRAPASSAIHRPSTLLRASTMVHPARGLGMRAASRGIGARVVVAGSLAAVVAMVATLVFATSINALVSTPARYGWPYDLGVIIGFGYGGSDPDAIAASLDRPEVDQWGLVGLGSATLKGQTLPSVAGVRNFASVPTPVIEGERPDGPGEIALGTESAGELGLDIGDEVSVVTAYGQGPATVTGLVVLPPLGPYQSDRAATGTGVLLSERFFADMVAGSERAQGLAPGSLAATGLGSFLAINLADGVDVDDFLASIDADERLTWDLNNFESFVYPSPVQPAAIADVASMRRLPVALSGILALAMAIGLATGIQVTTRARRRELAILGALGCTSRQVASSVRWHALTVVALAVVAGVPLGIAGGGVLYRSFAVDLGVLPTVETSLLATAAVAVGTVIVGLLASTLPARRISNRQLAASLQQP